MKFLRTHAPSRKTSAPPPRVAPLEAATAAARLRAQFDDLVRRRSGEGVLLRLRLRVLLGFAGARGGGYLTGGSAASSCEDKMQTALRMPARRRALRSAAAAFCFAERSWSTFSLVRAINPGRHGWTKSGKCNGKKLPPADKRASQGRPGPHPRARRAVMSAGTQPAGVPYVGAEARSARSCGFTRLCRPVVGDRFG